MQTKRPSNRHTGRHSAAQHAGYPVFGEVQTAMSLGRQYLRAAAVGKHERPGA